MMYELTGNCRMEINDDLQYPVTCLGDPNELVQ